MLNRNRRLETYHSSKSFVERKNQTMGKSYHRRIHRRGRLSKARRKKERRRIRSKNRQLKDKNNFTNFVHKTWPCVFENHSTIPNIESDLTLDELTSFTLLQIGNTLTQRYLASEVKSMTTMERVNESIRVIADLLDESDDQNIYRDLLNVMKFLTSCKKQLLRRGAVATFAGHRSKHVTHTSTKPMSQNTQTSTTSFHPPLHPIATRHHVLDIPEPPPLPTQEQLSGRRKKPAMTCKIGVPSTTNAVRAITYLTDQSHETLQRKPDKDSWSCNIM